MRRILFGGIGLALGVFATPAAAQDSRPGASPPQRAARLGAPVAIPESSPTSSPSDAGVTPAGLLRRPVEVVLPSSAAPPSTGGYVGGLPANGIPVGVPVTGGTPVGVPSAGPTLAPMWRPAGSTPMVTEDRGAGTTPPAGGYPTIVPMIAPGGVGGMLPDMDAPLYGCETTGMPVVGRVAGCGRWSVSGEYLMWWNRAADLPALVTTSSPQFNGRVGVGDTRVLVGDNGFGETFHSGFRVSGVRWFGDSTCRGIDARLFFLGQAASSFTATSGQFPLLARPFINPNPGTPFFGSDAEVISAMNFTSGGVNVQLENTVWGAEANYRRYLLGNACARVDALVGYRFLNVNEKLSITENLVRTPLTQLPAGSQFLSATIVDQFKTENYFHGGQVGLTGEIRRGRWSIDGRATIAFGALTRVAEISGGQSVAFLNGTMQNFNGGLLAIPGANIGRFSDTVFAVVPEVGVNVGYQLTSHLRVFVGYNFLYLSNALRPGNVIDPYVDPARVPNFLATPATPIPGLAHPTPQFRSAGFYVQGINFGLRWDW
jgi:hypothetical protein